MYNSFFNLKLKVGIWCTLSVPVIYRNQILYNMKQKEDIQTSNAPPLLCRVVLCSFPDQFLSPVIGLCCHLSLSWRSMSLSQSEVSLIVSLHWILYSLSILYFKTHFRGAPSSIIINVIQAIIML